MTPMHLWHVHRDEYGYDEYDAFIIRAETAEEARLMAQEQGGDALENWHVDEIFVGGETEIILSSFNAG